MIGEIAQSIERTLDTPFPTRTALEDLCREAREQNYRGIVIPSSCVLAAMAFLEDLPIKVTCLVGFPFGAMDSDSKRYEAEVAIDSGAHEIELIPSLGRLKDGDYDFVLRELRDVVEAADERPVKVVIEVPLWNEAELGEIVQVVLDSGAPFISTGLIYGPAKVEEIQKLRGLAGPQFGLKAAGLRAVDSFEPFISAGADLLGRGSVGIPNNSP